MKSSSIPPTIPISTSTFFVLPLSIFQSSLPNCLHLLILVTSANIFPLPLHYRKVLKHPNVQFLIAGANKVAPVALVFRPGDNLEREIIIMQMHPSEVEKVEQQMPVTTSRSRGSPSPPFLLVFWQANSWRRRFVPSLASRRIFKEKPALCDFTRSLLKWPQRHMRHMALVPPEFFLIAAHIRKSYCRRWMKKYRSASMRGRKIARRFARFLECFIESFRKYTERNFYCSRQ